jgi:hypothetical protein
MERERNARQDARFRARFQLSRGDAQLNLGIRLRNGRRLQPWVIAISLLICPNMRATLHHAEPLDVMNG